MTLEKFSQTLSELYNADTFKDYAPTGLVIEGRSQIQRGITAVSFSKEAVNQAIQKEADFLVVHHPHGFWDNQPRVLQGGFREKMSLMLSHSISLFSFHLPMDAQPQIGNNQGVLEVLGLELEKPFLPMGPNFIGLVGKYPSPITRDTFLKQVEQYIGPINFHFPYGKEAIERVAICTGGAASSIREAQATGADVFITGEAKEDTFVYCQDERFNFVAAGHHNTEVFGPKLLAKYLSEKERIPTEFVNCPNPV
jgi:dinuclear metal center YbgI/SA1388 family protein